MNAPRPSWLLLAAGAMVLAACSDDKATTTELEVKREASGPDYVLLLDDDSDPDQVLGRSGVYALTARGKATPLLAVLDVPAGYSNFGFFALVPEGLPNNDDPLRSVQYWTVHGVFVDPCAMDEDAPEAGTSVDDLAAALAAQNRTSVSKPVPVTLDGHDGLYLELTAPSDISFEDCALGYYAYWEGSPGNAQHTVDGPGTIDRTWILDADGERVVLVAAAPPEVTEAHVAELTSMVESVRFVERQ